ncbi:MAG: ABC transporter substrate-binding protein [Micropruina sp.]|uniref:ABC transporter substrate-binding protein n=1 Tax=Micropruina sp. TaxID=2737536 RepID=UPI0039E2225A
MKTLRTRLGIPALVLAGLVFAGCSPASTSTPSAGAPASGYPATMASCGRDFSYAQAPSRVVLGNYRTLKTLDALGVAGSVTGYLLGPDDRGIRPTTLPANLELVSPDAIPAREPVIAAKPDLFLSFNEAQLVGRGTLSYDDLADIGANAYVMGGYCATAPNNRTIDTVYADIANLGTMFGVPDRAERLNKQLKDRVAAAKQSLAGSTGTVAFLKVLGGKVYAIGGYPASAMLGALGLTNQFADLPTPFAELSAEQALAMKPDLVFVNYVGDERAAIAALGKVLPDLPAVKEGRVRGADENLAQGSGVGVVDALEALAADVKSVRR